MSRFDDIIKDKANSHEAPVPPGAWDKIIKKKKKRRFIFWIFFLAVLIIAGVGTPAYLHWKNKDAAKQTVAATKTQNDPALVQQEKNEQEKTIAENEKDKSVVAENEAATKLLNKQPGNESPVISTTGNQQQDINAGKKISGSKKAVIKTSTHAGEIASTDQLSGKTIEKQTKGKRTAKTSGAETGELSLNNADDEQTQKEKANDIAVADKTQQTTNEIVPAVPAETKKNETPAENKQPPATADKKVAVNVKKRLLFADISFMPFIAFQQSSNSGMLSRTTFSNNVLSEFKANSINTTLDPSVAFQLTLRKNISSRWQLGAGVQYMQLKETIKLSGDETTTVSGIVQRLVTQNGQQVLVDDTVQTVVEGKREINAVNSYRFISIPLFMQYSAGKFAGLNLSITGGFYFNIHSRYSNSIDPLISSGNNNAKSNTGIDMFAGLRLSKMYGRRIGLFAEPSARFTIKQANIKDVLMNKKLQQAGIAVGVSVLLK